MTYVRPWRLTTVAPGLRFSDFRELRTFISCLLVRVTSTLRREHLFHRHFHPSVLARFVARLDELEGSSQRY
jgi:hypothetical protein